MVNFLAHLCTFQRDINVLLRLLFTSVIIMDSLSQLLSSPLLDFVSSANTERPDELDMLLETVSDSDIQLLDSTNTNNSSTVTKTVTNKVANASNDVLCRDTCSSHIMDHTSSTSAFALTTETDLK